MIPLVLHFLVAKILSGGVIQRKVDIKDTELIKHYQKLEKTQSDAQKQSSNLKRKFEAGIGKEEAERACKKLCKAADQYSNLFASLPELQKRSSGHIPKPELPEPTDLTRSLLIQPQKLVRLPVTLPMQIHGSYTQGNHSEPLAPSQIGFPLPPPTYYPLFSHFPPSHNDYNHHYLGNYTPYNPPVYTVTHPFFSSVPSNIPPPQPSFPVQLSQLSNTFINPPPFHKRICY